MHDSEAAGLGEADRYRQQEFRIGESGYRLLQHTADTGVVAWGPTPPHAFAEAAYGLFTTILSHDARDEAQSGDREEIEVQVEGESWDDLLVNWLAELLFLFETEGFVGEDVAVGVCAPPLCTARLRGQRHHGEGHPDSRPVKAVTYHQLSVAVGEHRTEVRVIFDV